MKLANSYSVSDNIYRKAAKTGTAFVSILPITFLKGVVFAEATPFHLFNTTYYRSLANLDYEKSTSYV
jgi:hypothetical protein